MTNPVLLQILYAPNGHKEITNRFCFLAMSAVSQTLNRQGIECPMFQFEHVEEEEDIKDMLLNQVGVEHASESITTETTHSLATLYPMKLLRISIGSLYQHDSLDLNFHSIIL